MKRIAILQSNYIPWKGYFDLLNMVDEFVIFDTAQFTKNDWRNRNKIKAKDGTQWLTIPCRQESLGQTIAETKVTDFRWAKKHWSSIKQTYAKSKYFKDYQFIFERYYMEMEETSLSNINYSFIYLICEILEIKTKITWSSDYNIVEGKTDKLIDICKQAGASKYLSGPSAKNYFDESLAKDLGITVEWMDYSNYPEYSQAHPPFEHSVSILDLIFNEGQNAKKFMKSFR